MGGIFKRIFGSIIIVGFIPILFVIISLFYYRSVLKDNLIKNWQTGCDILALSAYENVNNFAKRLDYLDYLRSIYRNDDDFLDNIVLKYNEIVFVSILDENGREKTRYKKSKITKLFKTIDISNEIYFSKLKKEKEGVIGNFRIVRDIPLATIVYPLKNEFVYCVVDFKEFFNYVYSLRFGTTGFVFFVGENGVILSDKNLDVNQGEINKIFDNFYGSIYPVISGEKYIGAYRKIADLDIYLVLVQNQKEFLRDINLMFYSLLFIILFVLTISYFFALHTSSKFIIPLSWLIKSSYDVSNGIFKKIDGKSEIKEFNELINVFNHMTSKLDEYNRIKIEEIMDEREKLNIIAQNLKTLIVLSNLSGYPVYINNVAKKIFGENPQEVRDKIHNIIFKISSEKNKIISFNNNYYEVSVNIIQLQREKPLVLFVADDVTLEVNIQKMKEEIFRSIAHDLRSPLLNMQGYIKLLSYTEDEKIKNYLNGLKEESDIVFKMIENILDISRIEDRKIDLKIEKININELIRKLVSRFMVRAKIKEIDFKFYISDKEVLIYGDENLLSRAIENILTNAFKYTDNGGKVEVVVEDDENFVKIRISDTGRGIEEDKLDRIFEKFTSFSKDGFGLGLSIAKNIVEMHKGKIYVKSKLGEGSVFIIEFKKGVNDL